MRVKLTDAERVLKHTNTFEGRMNRLVIGARASAKQKGYTFSIDRDYLYTLWDIQNGMCSYTGWPMTFETHDQFLVSIDRIDSSFGYVEGNTQLTSWIVNRAKSTMTGFEFQMMCAAVSCFKKF